MKCCPPYIHILIIIKGITVFETNRLHSCRVLAHLSSFLESFFTISPLESMLGRNPLFPADGSDHDLFRVMGMPRIVQVGSDKMFTQKV